MRISISFVLSTIINLLLFLFILPKIDTFALLNPTFPSLQVTIVSQVKAENQKEVKENTKTTETTKKEDVYDDPIIKTLNEYRFQEKKNDIKTSSLKAGILPKTKPSGTNRVVEKEIFGTEKVLSGKRTDFAGKRIEFEDVNKGKIISFEELAKIGIPNFSDVLDDLHRDYELKLRTISKDKAKFLQGTVLVQLDIEKDGRVSNIKVISSPDPILADISIRNLLKLRPSPRNSTLKALRVKIEFERK